jgi:hypothetical protein
VSAATVHELLTLSRTLVSSDNWATSYWWGRGSAVLARQAVELALEEFWDARAPDMREASGRGQFLAVRLYLNDETQAAEGHATWSRLSRACHHHPYDLQPSRDEVVAWIDAAERFHAVLQSARHEPITR